MKGLRNLCLSAAALICGMGAANAAIPTYLNIDPTPGSTVEEIKTFTISSTMFDEFWVLGTSRDKLLVDGEVVSYTSKPVDSARTGLIFTLNTPVTTPGQHEITFLEGLYIFDFDETPNDQFSFSYVVAGDEGGGDEGGGGDIPDAPILGPVPTYLNIDPAPDSYVESFTGFTISSTMFEEFWIMGSSANKLLVDGQPVKFTSKPLDSARTGLIFNLNEAVTQKGRHVVSLLAGIYCFDEDETLNDAFSFVINVGQNETPEPEQGEIPATLILDPAPGSTVDNITTITITSDTYKSNFWIRAGSDQKFLINNELVPFTSRPLNNDNTKREGLTITLTNPITESGEYTVTMLEGMFSYGPDDIQNTSFSFNLTVESSEEEPDVAVIPNSYSVEPAPGSVVKEISQFVITSSVDDDFYIPRGKKIFIDDVETEFNAQISGSRNNIITVTLKTPVTTPGKHTIRIPAYTFEYGDYDEGTDEFIFTLIVEDANIPEPDVTVIPKTYTVTPAPGSTVESIETITVESTVDGYFYVYTNAKIYINEEAVAFTSTVSGANSNKITFTLAEPITETGRYVINIPANSFDIDEWAEETNEEFIFTVYVEAPEVDPDPEDITKIPATYTVTPAPGSTVNSIETITVESTVDGDFYVYSNAKLYINEEAVAFTSTVSGTNSNKITFTLAEPITETGRYVINIPANSFDIDEWGEESNEEFIFTVYVESNDPTGIEGVEEEINTGSIYTLDGIKVTEMQPGRIYIIDGRKVMIK